MATAGDHRLGITEARGKLSSILREFAELEAPSESIVDRAIRLAFYKRDVGVLLPLTDFERALETEEIADEILLELSVEEGLARGEPGWHSLEEVARELGLAAGLAT